MYFVRSPPDSFVRDLYRWDAATGTEQRVLTAAQLLDGHDEQINAEEMARRERLRLAARGIADFELSHDGKFVLVPLSDDLFIVQVPEGTFRRLPVDLPEIVDPRWSPDSQWVSFVAAGDLYAVQVATGKLKRMTAEASGVRNFGSAEFVAQEEMDRMQGYWWSPDSQFLVYQETDLSEVAKWHVADVTKPGSEPRAWHYQRPGQANARGTLWIHALDGKRPIPVNWELDEYPYLARVGWQHNERLTILVQVG